MRVQQLLTNIAFRQATLLIIALVTVAKCSQFTRCFDRRLRFVQLLWLHVQDLLTVKCLGTGPQVVAAMCTLQQGCFKLRLAATIWSCEVLMKCTAICIMF